MFVVDVEQVTCLFATMILSVKTYEMHYDSCLMLYGSSSHLGPVDYLFV